MLKIGWVTGWGSPLNIWTVNPEKVNFWKPIFKFPPWFCCSLSRADDYSAPQHHNFCYYFILHKTCPTFKILRLILIVVKTQMFWLKFFSKFWGVKNFGSKNFGSKNFAFKNVVSKIILTPNMSDLKIGWIKKSVSVQTNVG